MVEGDEAKESKNKKEGEEVILHTKFNQFPWLGGGGGGGDTQHG